MWCNVLHRIGMSCTDRQIITEPVFIFHTVLSSFCLAGSLDVGCMCIMCVVKKKSWGGGLGGEEGAA